MGKMTAQQMNPKRPASGGDQLGPVAAGVAYPLRTFMGLTGLDKAAMRTARRAGLVVRKVGRRSFVLGSDFLAYLAAQNGRGDSESAR